MKRGSLLITTLTISTALLVGCADRVQRFLGDRAQADPAQTSPEFQSTQSLSPDEAWRSAQQLAWEAAVLVQKPPHPVTQWQTARVKWREAIRLLESIPPQSDRAAPARQRLAVYRRNYETITQRLQTEAAAVRAWERAQEAAWQAAMTVQDPPHALAVWQRATDRWGEAVRLLEAVPPLTTVSAAAQQKAVNYRQNYRAIAQQLARHQAILEVQTALADRVAYVNQQQRQALIGQTADPIGMTYEEYQDFVRSLAPLQSRLSALKDTVPPPVYEDMQAVITDYQFALRLWHTYEQYKTANADWLQNMDFFNRLVPLTPTDRDRLLHRYVTLRSADVRLFYGSQAVKVPLKSTVWEIWQTATDRMQTVERTTQYDSIKQISTR